METRELSVGEPVRDLSHLSPALRRRVVEAKRFGHEINRIQKKPPRIEHADHHPPLSS